MHLRLSTLWWVLVVVAVGLPGCKRLSTGAREHFARKLSCPEERVTVKPREDLRYGELVAKVVQAEVPPDEVKRDPERLAKFQRDQAQAKAEQVASLDGVDVFEVTGCGHTQLLGCAHPVGGSDNSAQSDLVNCFEPPPGVQPEGH
jgi:hypothetical protein